MYDMKKPRFPAATAPQVCCTPRSIAPAPPKKRSP